jgi:hypothetical protein
LGVDFEADNRFQFNHGRKPNFFVWMRQMVLDNVKYLLFCAQGIRCWANGSSH